MSSKKIWQTSIFVIILLTSTSFALGQVGSSASNDLEKEHMGSNGGEGDAPSTTSRFTLDYNQPGDGNAESASFTMNVGWFDPPEEEEVVVGKVSRGGGRGGGGGGTGRLSACADGKDNDGDGRVDMADPDCTSAFGNEGSAICTPSWSCTSWTNCADWVQTRICSDLNGCESEKTETRACSIPIVEENEDGGGNINQTDEIEEEEELEEPVIEQPTFVPPEIPETNLIWIVAISILALGLITLVVSSVWQFAEHHIGPMGLDDINQELGKVDQYITHDLRSFDYQLSDIDKDIAVLRKRVHSVRGGKK